MRVAPVSRPLAALLTAALVVAAPAVGQDMAATRQSEPALRRELRHQELLDAYRTLTADDAVAADAAGRLAAISLEMQALTRAGSLDDLRKLDPKARVAQVAGAAERTAQEHLAVSGWLFLVGAVAEAEDALAGARTLDPGLKAATDDALAAARGQGVPKGGYHRYRGQFLPLDVRDRARTVDLALEAIAGLGLDAVRLPFTPSTEETNLERFAALGGAGHDALRAAAASVREALAPDYAEVRGWLASYARSERQRTAILTAYEALRAPRNELLQLIGRYDKPEQGQVDAQRAALEDLYETYEREVERDRAALARLSAESAHALLLRVTALEAALTAADTCLVRETGKGLGPHPYDRPADAATSEQRHLPGREQSGLEDVLWLLLKLRAHQVGDVLGRGADLMRVQQQMTPWERWLVEEQLAEAIDIYNGQAAFSLDATEWQFVDVLNRYRRVLGLQPFEVEERMNAASRKHSQEMVDLGYFGHISPVPRNRGPSDRVRLEGYGGGVGENCLGGSVDGRGAFEGWYHSPGHHRGMVSRSPHLGVGAARSHSMWTMVMGGGDVGWRSLHEDLPPARAQACRDAVAAWAKVLQIASPSPKDLERAALGRADVDALFPDVLPFVARLAFEAAKDPRHGWHEAAPALLAYVVDADVPVTWRPLQIASVAAAIDILHLGGTTEVRRRALELVAPLTGNTYGYSAEGSPSARLDATLQIRALWEDHAQWKYRRTEPAPEVVALPGRSDGPSAKAKLRVLAKPERLKLARANGGGSDTERAIELGLDFLVRAQDPDGAWRARAFVLNHRDFDARNAGMGNAEWDIAMTGLSVLAFVSSGHTPDQGDHQEVVRRGVEWLKARVIDYGKFETVSGHYMYGHAIATQALCEAFAYTDDPSLGAAAQLALDYIAFSQDPNGGGWRYDARQAGDTSVVGWVVMALNAGFKANLQVVGFRDAIRFLDAVTMSGYYQVGYTHRPGLAPENLRLTAAGMTSRLFLGQEAHEAKIAMPAWRLIEQLPSKHSPDFYYWYYGTLSLFQVGGQHWKTWNKALKESLLELQETNRGSAYAGSWPPDGAYGGQGGRIYQTALGILMLTTYYRYDRAPKIKVYPFTGNLREHTAPFLATLRDEKDPQTQALVLQKLVDEIGPSLVPVIAETAANAKEPKELREMLARALVTISEPRHEALILPLLGSDNGVVAANAARAIAENGSDTAAQAMIAALNHGNRNVRIFAARALGRLGIHEAALALSTRADAEGDNGVKNEIAAALRMLATRDSLSKLVDRALPKGQQGRLAVYEGLDLLHGDGIADRLVALESAEEDLFDKAVGAIEEHRGGALVPLLVVLLESDSIENRQVAIKYLQAITRHTHGFKPEDGPGDRKKAVKEWERWWKQAGGGYAEEKR